MDTMERTTGCDTIIAQILDEARQAGAIRLAQADEQAARLAAEARETAADQAEAVLSEGKTEQESILRAACSAAALLVRNARLRQRRHELDEAMAATTRYLNELPAAEYFARLYPLLENSVQPGRGVLRLNERDLARLPADFDETVRALLEKRHVEVSVVVAGVPAPIDGGFLLQYGDVEVSASFAALTEEKREALEDLFNRELFAE